jgi:hypothetical protein
VRGALVIYDLDDPHGDLYDFDDGEINVKYRVIVDQLSRHRGHRYYACGLVPLFFITGTAKTVSVLITLVEI